MELLEREFDLPAPRGDGSLIEYFAAEVRRRLSAGETPVRFVVTGPAPGGLHCEVLHAGGSVEEFVPAHVAKALQAGRRG